MSPEKRRVNSMRPATQPDTLPNDIASLICKLGEELSCSICRSVFEDATMTPCNHTFCRGCIEKAVASTNKSSVVPLNLCPNCKGKVPKRSLNPSAATSKLCTIYEQIVRSYSEMNGGNEDWIHRAGVRVNDSYYTGGGAPLENLSQLCPYPEKPDRKSQSKLENISETECDSDSSDLLGNFTDIEEDALETQLDNETSRIYDETTQLTIMKPSQAQIHQEYPASFPSSPLLIYATEESQLLTCDKMMNINTQELENLSAINDSIDKELAELEKKLAASKQSIVDKENIDDGVSKENISNNTVGVKLDAKLEAKLDAKVEAKVKVYSSKIKVKNSKTVTKTPPSKITTITDETSLIPSPSVITTTGIKDEKSLVQLTKFSDRFNYQIFSDFQFSSTLVVPTGTNLIVKKRTMKYFEALILEKEIISFDWIVACLKADKLFSSSGYKIKGDEVGKGNKRISIDYSKLFTNHKFYFYGEFSQPPRDQLETLVLSSKSTIIQTAQDLTRGSVVLADPNSQFTFEKDAEFIKKYPIVSPAWFLDSISCGRALDFHGYLIL